jgi:excisionase family DNA binding protein
MESDYMESQDIYTVDQVAQILEMHPRTIRRYIRDGRLKATKVGGEWRIKGMDLNGLMNGNVNEIIKESKNDVIGFVEGRYSELDSKVQVCTVIDYYVDSPEEAGPMSQALVSLMNSGDPDQMKAKFQYVYDQEEKKARFILWGNPKFLAKMLTVVSDNC